MKRRGVTKSKYRVAAIVLAAYFVMAPVISLGWSVLSVPDYHVRSLKEEFFLRGLPFVLFRYYSFRMTCNLEPKHRIVTLMDRDRFLGRDYLKRRFPECEKIVSEYY